MKIIIIICCIVGVAIQIHAQSYIIPNGVTLFPNTGIGQEIRVIQGDTGDYTGFFLDTKDMHVFPLSPNYFYMDMYMDEGVRVYEVLSGDLDPIPIGYLGGQIAT